MAGCTASSNSSHTPDPPAGDTGPTTPANLQPTASSNTQVGLVWTASTDNIGVAGYQVDRCVGSGCATFAQVATVTVATFSDSGLLSGTSYGYRVRATDTSGNLSGYSSIAYVTTTGTGDKQAPSAPSGLTATAASSAQIGLTWSASTDNVSVTGYQVERCSGASCTAFAQVGTTSGASATTFNS